MHKLRQTLCDRKTKPASFCVAGAVAAHESLHQLFTGNIELAGGNIAKYNAYQVRLWRQRRHIDVYTGSRLRILADIVHQIVENSPKMSSIRTNIDRWVWAIYNKLQSLCI